MTRPKKIFIDGVAGTTGLLIRSLLEPRARAGEISIVSIPDHREVAQRQDAFADADLSILCVPDDVARGAVTLLQGAGTRVIDASSAHRTHHAWVYGFPELGAEQRARIAAARFVTNPGCYAAGAVAILRPLVAAELIDPARSVTITGAAGYSAGGKSLIERYEAGGERFALAHAFTAHSIDAKHKHAGEIRHHAGLRATPVFLPHVVGVPRGMMISIGFSRDALRGDRAAVQRIYERAYGWDGSKVVVAPPGAAGRRLDLGAFAAINATGAGVIDTITLHIAGWDAGDDDGQVTVFALLDNLGKGAATQAIQNAALMLDLPP